MNAFLVKTVRDPAGHDLRIIITPEEDKILGEYERESLKKIAWRYFRDEENIILDIPL